MQERKKRRRRGRYSFLLTFFVAAALIFALVLTSGLFFNIREIRVEGVTVTNPQEIIALSGYTIGENIFLINKRAAYHSITASLPYVKAVRTRRDWPGTVVIIITEAAPAAMIEHRGVYWVFDSQGSLLESVPALTPPKLPVIKGMALLDDPVPGTKLYPVTEDTAKSGPLLDLIGVMLAEGVWEDVGEIDITQLSGIRFTYKGIYKVELGPPDALAQKFRVMLLALEDEKVSGRGPGTLYIDGIADGKNARFIPDEP
ncbi:MAG: FtsQ-type POTRA domain-containing protein [Oscillospiraceae bacterium]|jgi:cell division protein FtsQ|nr:FtsQ-type POTRA domain-containing protein [Oscillospiraceae bacterium]